MKRQKHNLSHYHLTSIPFGKLVPIGCLEVLPGDTFQHATSVLLRCTPLLAPVMHQVDCRVHHFFVPNRVIWDNWESFIVNQMLEGSLPTISYNPGSSMVSQIELLDHLGVAIGRNGVYPNDPGRTVNALPIYAYNMIWNEFYRDQQLQATERDEDDTSLAPVSWHKDYFTTARPFPQQGASVTLPLGSTADVVGYYEDSSTASGFDRTPFAHGGTHNPVAIYGDSSTETGNPVYELMSGDTWTQFPGDELHLNPGRKVGEVDLSLATAASVLDVRRAFAVQRFYEQLNRYGSRYTEYLRYMGVTPADSRLQRPEYLGGGKTTISFSEVLQTAEGSNPVGEMRGHGIAALRSNRYRKFFDEHGYVLSLLSVVPRNCYADATPRHWLKREPFDIYNKELQMIGEQEVWKGELWPDKDTDRETFGYQTRYSEYMSQPSQVTGEFRGVYNDWHMARFFAAQPALNSSFIECVPSLRNFADQTNDPLLVYCRHNIGARRQVRRVNIGRVV